MNIAVFLDRDGTIAYDAHYCSSPENFILLPTVSDAIRLFNEHGFKVIVVTNQSGIARGYFTEEILTTIHQKMEADLNKSEASIDAIYYCPHHPDEDCNCRKPKTALFEQAAEKLDVDLNRSFVIGDTPMDIKAGKTLGCKTVMVTTGPSQEIDSRYSPDFIADTLLEAAQWIIDQ